MRMDGKCVLKEAREGKEKKLPEKPEVQNKDWLSKEALFRTEEFIVWVVLFVVVVLLIFFPLKILFSLSKLLRKKTKNLRNLD